MRGVTQLVEFSLGGSFNNCSFTMMILNLYLNLVINCQGGGPNMTVKQPGGTKTDAE